MLLLGGRSYNIESYVIEIYSRHMRRHEIIEQVGKHYYVDNLENGEFRYPKALADEGKSIDDALVVSEDGTKHTTLDLRFVDGDVSILIETKNDYDKWNDKKVRRQMQAYVNYEKVLTGNKIIAIIANTEDDRVKLWWGRIYRLMTPI